MQVETFTPSKTVSGDAVQLTDAAIRHFESKVEKTPGHVVRLSTKTSGCTGYAYVLDIVAQATAGDTELHVSEQLTFCIAADALPLVRNTEIDYVKEGLNGVLKFNNPNVVAECGCGESFNVS
ncbi:HesB/IscA family protein [Alkalimonas mucilaginosa]|uniref:Iron-sulfur cluster assembly accessory protein n=1 Tax=Alkalimonas mucilaginosa TaxID=3057676 RepID=A0ABU7JHF7_9GAMM|nr:iron-sulfur cluster assembly accessory protein [Alkalimonas sp. MEB004]MEE2024890.1 iron-sulfur cluster assembly accessory protein [Alkalimonas sp. MEB004]